MQTESVIIKESTEFLLAKAFLHVRIMWKNLKNWAEVFALINIDLSKQGKVVFDVFVKVKFKRLTIKLFNNTRER